nr:aminotransferase class I/II-fold pyridoxal phosphate-dependent enzyme [Ornithinimicrobium cryptoxanthini]
MLSQAHVTEVEERYVLDALRSGWVAPLGPHVDAFEAEVAERVGVAGALALSSGTAALHLALLELGAGPDKMVLVPSMTFAATVNAVMYTGAEPFFIDSQLSDGNVDPHLLIEAVDALRGEGRDIATVITVDLFGRCCDYDVIEPALVERGIPLLEDAAEALGATYGGRAAGSFGRAAALSFNGNKVMTTSGGGMLLSDDLELLDRCRYLSTQARQPVPWYEHTEVGYNYRLSNLLAALGRAQLTRLDDMIARRRHWRSQYRDLFEQHAGVRILGGADDSEDNCWLTAIAIDPETATITLDTLGDALHAARIDTRPVWKPMHLQPAWKGLSGAIDGTSERIFDQGLTLPSGSAMTDEQFERVLLEITKVVA